MFLLVGPNPHVPNLQWKGYEIAELLLGPLLTNERHSHPFRRLVEILVNSLPFSICMLYVISTMASILALAGWSARMKISPISDDPSVSPVKL